MLHAWGLTGKATEHTADEIINDAKAILDETEGKYRTHALFALCEAKGCDDNIIIEEMAFPLLRQQHTQADKPNLCLSDFVSPYGDKIGLFATTIDGTFGTGHSDDPYHNLLAQTLADRLAEATASLMHRQIRTQKELWGYSQHEELTIKELLQEKNQGIRPAVGYPSLPDQSIIFLIDELLHLDHIGITLSENGAMHPHCSVSGFMFAHPKAQYFTIGTIGDDQLRDYAHRRQLPTEEIEKFLYRNR
jgi:cobalamin-dependent methionine synthase I